MFMYNKFALVKMFWTVVSFWKWNACLFFIIISAPHNTDSYKHLTQNLNKEPNLFSCCQVFEKCLKHVVRIYLLKYQLFLFAPGNLQLLMLESKNDITSLLQISKCKSIITVICVWKERNSYKVNLYKKRWVLPLKRCVTSSTLPYFPRPISLMMLKGSWISRWVRLCAVSSISSSIRLPSARPSSIIFTHTGTQPNKYVFTHLRY